MESQVSHCKAFLELMIENAKEKEEIKISE